MKLFKHTLFAAFALLLLLSATLANAQSGSASGIGTLRRVQAGAKPGPENWVTTDVMFEPRHSFAYTEGSGATKSTWIVLTEKAPPAKEWLAAKDRAEAREQWGTKEKAAFVAVKLDPEMKVDLLFLSSGPGQLDTQMVSSWNGLQSARVEFDGKPGKRLLGALRGGNGSCSKDGKLDFCERKFNYSFDVSLP